MYGDIIGPAIEVVLKIFEGVRHMFETKAERERRERDKQVSHLIRRLTGEKNRHSIAFTVDSLVQVLGWSSEDVLDSLVRLQKEGEVYEDEFGWHAGTQPAYFNPRFRPRF